MKSKITSYRDLDVYQRAYNVSISVMTKVIPNLPESERYDLKDQLSRSSKAVPRLIAEGFAKKHQKSGFQKYIDDAMAESNETQVGLSQCLDIYSKYIDITFCENLIREYDIIGKQLYRLRESWDKFSRLKPKDQTGSQDQKLSSGQSLVEIIIAIAVGAILIGGATAVLIPILRSNLETRHVQIATSLAQEYLDNLQSLAESDWQIIYSPPSAKGPSSQFYLRATSTTYEILSGATSTVVEGRTFTRYFSIENTSRNLCGASDITTNATSSCASGPGSSGVADDPSTQKITTTITWPESRSISKTQYLTRNINKVFVQTDWSAGPGQEGPITSENNQFATSTNINYTTTTGSIIINL